MKYIYVENGLLNGVGEVRQIDNDVINLEISEEIYRNYISEPFRYIYSDDKLIENPQYAELKQKNLNQERKSEIQRQIDELDKKRIRAICEDEIKDEKTGETWLEYYNGQIFQLRSEIQSLS